MRVIVYAWRGCLRWSGLIGVFGVGGELVIALSCLSWCWWWRGRYCSLWQDVSGRGRRLVTLGGSEGNWLAGGGGELLGRSGLYPSGCEDACRGDELNGAARFGLEERPEFEWRGSWLCVFRGGG